jgi:hypothetical protein
MKVGTIVQCIDDAYPEKVYENCLKAPKFGEHYTIREIINAGKVGLLLVEIINPNIKGTLNGVEVFAEPQWLASRFREVEGLDDLVTELIEESMHAEA